MITGAGRGLGKATALVFAQQGHDIVVADLNADQAQATAREVTDLGRLALAHRTDIGSRASVEALAAAAGQRFGSVDVLVNNAAVIAPAPALEMTDEQWDRVLDVGLKRRVPMQPGLRSVHGATAARRDRQHCVGGRRPRHRRASELLRCQGGRCGIESGAGGGMGAPFGVRVNAVGPGYINTELQQQALAQGLNSLESLTWVTPLGRLAEPTEIAQVIAFLASPEASYVTGQVIFADGGWLAAAPR